MIKRINFIVIILSVLCSSMVFAQTKKWNIHTDMKDVKAVTVSGFSQIAFSATSGGLYEVDLNNGNILAKFTLVNGLICNDLTALITDSMDRIWIGASDGSISIFDYRNNSWKYIYDIKNSNESDKTINGFIATGNYIFVATGYGIQKISTLNLSFVDAPYYQLGTFSVKTKVFNLTVSNGYLFAGTASGVAYALLSANLNYPASWQNYSTSPLNTNISSIESFDNKVFVSSANGFAYFNFSNWLPYPNVTIANLPISCIKSFQDSLYFSIYNNVYKATKNNLENPSYVFLALTNVSSISIPSSGKLVVGCNENGLRVNIADSAYYIYPNGLNRNSCFFVNEDDFGNIWIAGGPAAGFCKFDGNSWTGYYKETNPLIGTYNDFRCIVPNGNKVWAMSFGGGVTKIEGNTFRNYSPTNSTLPGVNGYPYYCVPVGGAVDINGVLWVSLFAQSSGNSLYAYTGNDSIWVGFANPGTMSLVNFEHMAVDPYNTKWVVSGEIAPRGLYFFNENGTINNPNDDISGMYYLSDFGVEDVTDVVVDRNGEVWIATNNGVFIISNPLAAITNPSQKPAPVKLGIISGNLKVPFTENCNCITIDILNQKWIGTESNGVFHLSEDGSTLIDQFNISNSPIADNKINSIAVSSKSGKAYFATLKGLSYIQTTAIKPLLDFDKITCAPNPYLIPSNVNLRIDGLIESSSIKIISLTGELISEFDSPGGRIAEWNGYDKKGNLVPSGIYIVVAYNKDGTKVGKGKVAIVRK